MEIGLYWSIRRGAEKNIRKIKESFMFEGIAAFPAADYIFFDFSITASLY
jgi:hypothetical protein